MRSDSLRFLFTVFVGSLLAGLLLSAQPGHAQPQNLTVERITVRDGLANNSITDILQDRQGFMWFATSDGLNRYDGYQFTVYRHDSLDVTSLSHSRIESLYEDSEGTLWVGTFGNGLNRFDRETESFTRFLHDPNDPTSLSGHNVSVLLEDRRGTLWVGTNEGGLNRFDHATETFTRFLHDPADEQSLIDNRVRAIFEDSRGTFWVGTWGDGLHTMDRRTGTFTRHRYDPDAPGTLSQPHLDDESHVGPFAIGTGVSFIHEDRSGALWIGAYDGGLNRYDPATGTVTHYEYDPRDPNSLSANTVWTIHESREGTLWIGTLAGGGLTKIDLAARQFAHYSHDPDESNSLSADNVVPIYEEASGTRWIGTLVGGLNRIDAETGVYTHYRHDPTDAHSLSNDTVTALHEDPSGTLWVGTYGGGLNRFDRETETFTAYRHDPDDSTSLSHDNLTVIQTDATGTLWVGTVMGLNRFDPQTESFTRFMSVLGVRYRPALFSALAALDREQRSLAALLQVGGTQDQTLSFEVEATTSVLIVSLGEFWGGNLTDQGWIEDEDGVVVWQMTLADTQSAGGTTANRAQMAAVTLAPGTYRLRYRSDPGYHYNAWQGTPPDHPERWGIQVYTLNGRASPLAPEDEVVQKPGAIGGETILSIIEDAAGTLWIGTDMGLNKFNRETNTFIHYPPAQPVHAIHEDRRGQLWLGIRAQGGGLFLFDRATGNSTSFTASDGLLVNLVQGILEDRDGILWLSTAVGLSRFDPENETFTNFDVSEGVGRFNQLSAYQSERGELFFGGPDGLTAFFPDQVTNTTPPSVALTGLRIFNDPVEPGPESPLDASITVAEELTLTHHQNDFTIDYAGLHFSDPTQNQYAYLLENYDEDWVQARSQRSARYARLSPGTYVFRVKAANNDGVWSEVEASIRVRALPPWWKTLWAYLAYGLLLVGGVFAIDRIQRRRLTRKERERAAIEQAHLRAEAAELQARALEAENERKALELEKARELERAYNQLQTTQAQLVQSEKMASLGQLTAGIAHEIKNPLNFINNFAELNEELAAEAAETLAAHRHTLPDEVADEVKALLVSLGVNAKQIAKHGQRADRIVKNMMEHATNTSGERYRLDLNAFVDEYVNLSYHGMQAQAPDFQAQIERRYDEAVGTVELAPQEMGRALLNLLNNAFEAVQEKADAGTRGRGDRGTRRTTICRP